MRPRRPPFGGVSGRPSDSQTKKVGSVRAFSARSLGQQLTNIRKLPTKTAETGSNPKKVHHFTDKSRGRLDSSVFKPAPRMFPSFLLSWSVTRLTPVMLMRQVALTCSIMFRLSTLWTRLVRLCAALAFVGGPRRVAAMTGVRGVKSWLGDRATRWRSGKSPSSKRCWQENMYRKIFKPIFHDPRAQSITHAFQRYAMERSIR